MTARESAFADPTAQRLQPIATGAEPEIVGPHLAEVLHDARWRECSVALISGGKSNLTYRVACDAGEIVLRRPPLGHVLPTAHDMAREFRVQSALHGTRVPVPRTLYLADAGSVLGVPFYLMERVVGHVCRNQLPPGYGETAAEREAIGGALIDTLAHLHAIDPAAAGLADFGRGAGFMERQLRRWSKQWDSSKSADLPALDSLSDELARTVPRQTAVTIVHGDYRLDNMILSDSGEVAAVVDWELCTLGDPLADVGMLLVYWSQEGDDFMPLFAPATIAPGFPKRDDVRARYAERSGRDLSEIDFFVALGYWKLAIILEGVYARYASGQYGKTDEGFQEFAKIVERLAEAADDAERRLS